MDRKQGDLVKSRRSKPNSKTPDDQPLDVRDRVSVFIDLAGDAYHGRQFIEESIPWGFPPSAERPESRCE